MRTMLKKTWKPMLLGLVMFAVLFSLNCFGAEAAPATAEASATAPQALAPWLQTLIGLAVTALSAWVLPYLHQAAAAAKAQAALHQIDTNTSLLNQREALLTQLKSFLFDQADVIATDRWPSLAVDISAGKLNSSTAVKAELYKWGDELRTNAIAYFKQNGIDIVALLGEKAIDDLITLVANKTSPFPGKEAASEVLKTNIVPLLIQNGVSWLRNHYATEGATPVIETVTLPTDGRGMARTQLVIRKVG